LSGLECVVAILDGGGAGGAVSEIGHWSLDPIGSPTISPSRPGPPERSRRVG
jgi:hypothetical protein